MSSPSKHYLTLASGKQLHYQRMGSGPTLLMLHPSPQSSDTMVPAMEFFSSYCTCIAIDTPGYGYSDDIDVVTPVIEDYLAPIWEALDLLGIEKFAVYGAATGAQIAIALGKDQPDRVSLVMLDMNGHLSEEEKLRILEGYMPAVPAIRSGGHLLSYWDMVRSLFVAFPWNSRLASERVPIEMPPVELLHTIFLRYLNAGEGYARAYRAAFDTESMDHLIDLKVPSTILRWKGSIVLNMCDDLIDMGLADNFTVLHADATLADRYEVQLAYLKNNYVGEPPPPLPNHSSGETLQREYLYTDNGAVHSHQKSSGTGRPIVVLHDLGQSSRQMTGLAKLLPDDRPFYAFDLPGHGGSGATENSNFDSIENYLEPLFETLNAPQFANVDVVGIGFGAILAAQLSQRLEHCTLYLIDPENAETNEDLDLTPKHNGSHLNAAWSKVLNSEFYKPWYTPTVEASLSGDANLDPDSLHMKAHDLLIVGTRFNKLQQLGAQVNWDAFIEQNNAAIFASSSRQSDLSRQTLLNVSSRIELGPDHTQWLGELGVW